jgi:DNA-binding MarR family transcriptional regulator
MPHFTPENFHNCHLGLLLGRAALLKDRIIDTHMEPHGVTAAQFKVLIIMAQFGVDTPAELCRNLSLDSGSMTRMLDRLEQKGLLDRKRSEQDGQRLADMLPYIGAQALNQLAGALEPGELQTLERILKKILIAAGDPITLQRVGKE